ncbi:MAG: hypothetical protein QM500_12755 [Methylococcales bacterium]
MSKFPSFFSVFQRFSLIVFLLMVSQVTYARGVNADQVVNLSKITTMPVNKNLLDSNDQPIAKIEASGLKDDNNVLIGGPQELEFTLKSEAKFPVVVNNTTVQPGETKTITIDSEDGHFLVPIFPAVNGVQGDAPFLASINVLTFWPFCSDGYNLEGQECAKYTHKNYTLTCPSNNYTLDSPSESCTWVDYQTMPTACLANWSASGSQCMKVSTISAPCNPCGSTSTRTTNPLYFDCPSNYSHVDDSCYKAANWKPPTSYSCKAGYTYNKWGVGNCTDSAAYVASLGADCGNGSTAKWDGSHYTCTFMSPSYYRAPYECTGSIVYNNNGNRFCTTGETIPAFANCPNGYSWNNSQCIRIVYTPPSYYCNAGWTLSGSQCSKTEYRPQEDVVCPSGYSAIGNNTCEKTTVVIASRNCPVNYTYDASTQTCVNRSTSPKLR